MGRDQGIIGVDLLRALLHSIHRIQTSAVVLGLTLMICRTALAADVNLTFISQDTEEPLSGVVAMIESGPAPAPHEAAMAQKNRAFVPHVLVVPVGSPVSFPNYDNTQHHVYSFSPAKPFNIELYAGKPESPIVFDKAGIVELGCNIHDQMQGFIVVTDTRHVGRSDERGEVHLTIPDALLAKGRSITLTAWHPRLTDNTTSQRFVLSGPAPIGQTIAMVVNPEPQASGELQGLQDRFRNL